MLESLNQYQFIIIALNLLILYVVLRKILFKPVTEFMEKRTKSIQDSLDDASKQREDAAALKRSYEEQTKLARASCEKMIDEAALKASRVSQAMLADAKRDAQAILDRARAEIEQERDQMLKDVRREIAGLALSAASKVMEANMNTDNNRALVDRFLDEAGVA